ncbi:MAG: redox-regulated ATPase YchF [Candidatus Falkowbacteria bacterium]
MALSIGIVGLPNVGKSTLFNALTKKGVDAANYPFCTIEPNVGIVKVPDHRLQQLAEISKAAKIINATVEFIDIAGLVRGASTGEGLGNKFLTHIRECDAICEVVRDFENKDIIHVDGRIDPKGDEETIGMELIFSDIATIDKRLEKLNREARSGDKDAIKQKTLFDRVKIALDAGTPARSLEYNEEELVLLKTLNLLTAKPMLYVVNTDDTKNTENFGWNGEVIKLNIKLEEEIANLPEEEQAEYIKELGLDESGLDKLIRAAYKLLGLDTYFTTGVVETRAWTIKRGSKAPQAAAVIHTDFEKGFIRAEVISVDKFVEAGGEAKAREMGYLRTEGKDYVVVDGDTCNFLVNR